MLGRTVPTGATPAPVPLPSAPCPRITRPVRCLPPQELAAEEDPAMLPTRRAGLYRLANAAKQAFYTLQVGALRELGVLTLAWVPCVHGIGIGG